MATPITNVQSSTKKATLKEQVIDETRVKITTKDHSKHADAEVGKDFEPLQGQGRGELQSSMHTPTYHEKGKAKVQSTFVHQVPHQLIKELLATTSSSSIATNDSTA